MRKMKRSDVREWVPGEPLERVDFGNCCTGMNKSIPKEPGSVGDFKRLIWKCRAIEADGGPCLVGELAKMLRQNEMDIGQNRLFRLLQADWYLGKSGSNRNVPTQRAMDLGLFRIKETTVTHADGHTTVSRTPKVTGKGQRYFIDRYWGRAQPSLEAGA